jgi:hypothetical protein
MSAEFNLFMFHYYECVVLFKILLKINGLDSALLYFSLRLVYFVGIEFYFNNYNLDKTN